MASTISIDVIFNAINKSANVFGQVNRGLNSMMNNMWKVNQAADLLDRTSSALNRLGMPGQEYDFGLKELSAITGIAGQDLNDLGKMARKVGKDSGLGATGALEAYKLLASQIEVDKIGMSGLNELQKRTITLAQASPKLGLEAAANSLAGTINQFGLDAGQANRVMNVLAAGSKYGAAEIPDLAMSFKVVGASAAAAGLDVETAGGAIEILSKNNLKGAEAGTALRNVLLKMQTELGFDFKVTKLSDALATLQGKEGDAAYMSKIFGMENITAAQYLVKNASAVDEMTKKMTGTNVATEQAVIMNNTWTHKMDVWKAKMNDLSISFFKGNSGLLGWVQMGGQAAATFTALSPIVGILGKGIFGTLSGIGQFAKAARLMNAALAAGKLGTYTALIQRYGMAGRIAAGSIWLKNQAVVFGTFVTKMFNTETRKATLAQLWQGVVSKAQAAWIWTVGKAQTIATGATWLWNRAMAFSTVTMGGVIASTWAWTAALLANPITWVVVGIAALIAGIALAWKHFDWFRGGIVGAWEAVKKFGQILWESIIEPIKLMIGGIGKLINAFTLLKNKDFKGAKNALKDGFGDIGKGMIQSTPIGIAMNVVKRRDEIGAAASTGYEKGKAIDTSDFLNFDKKKQQPLSAQDMQVPGFDMKDMQVPGLDMKDMQVPGLDMSGIQIPGIDMKDMQLPGFDQANTEVNNTYNLPGKVIQMTPNWMPENNIQQQKIEAFERRKQVAETLEKSGKKSEKINYSTPATPISNENNNVVNNDYLEQLTRNVTENTYNSSVANERSQDSRIEINYQPQVHVSATLTRENQENLMKLLVADKDKLMKLIKEELRKEGRLSYAG